MAGDQQDEEATLVEPLAALARRALGGEIADLRRLTGGASQQLWSFDVIRSDGRSGHVLRRLPSGDRIDRAGMAALETEAAVITAVAAAGVPVPRIDHVLAPADGIGRGFIASREPGEALGKRIVDDHAFAAIRPRLAADCGRILAAIHATPTIGLPPLSRRTPTDAIDHLEAQLRSHDEARPVFEAALIWLRANTPGVIEPTLVHGDFRTGNFLLEPGGISAILDWEGCHLGDPMADLGWLCMPIWRFGHLDRPVGGFGLRDDLYRSYAAASGEAVDSSRIRFWEILGMLRWGLTCMAMAAAFTAGERSIERAAIGRRACEAELELMVALSPEGRRRE